MHRGHHGHLKSDDSDITTVKIRVARGAEVPPCCMAAGFSPVMIRKYMPLIECNAAALVSFDISVYDAPNHIFQDRRFDLRKMHVRAVFARNRFPFPIFPLLLHHGREHGRLKSSIIFFFLFIFLFSFFSKARAS